MYGLRVTRTLYHTYLSHHFCCMHAVHKSCDEFCEAALLIYSLLKPTFRHLSCSLALQCTYISAHLQSLYIPSPSQISRQLYSSAFQQVHHQNTGADGILALWSPEAEKKTKIAHSHNSCIKVLPYGVVTGLLLNLPLQKCSSSALSSLSSCFLLSWFTSQREATRRNNVRTRSDKLQVQGEKK